MHSLASNRRATLRAMTEATANEDRDTSHAAADYVFDAAEAPVAAAIADAAFTSIDFGYATVLRIKDAAQAHGVGDTPLEMELIHAAGHDLQREVDGKPGCELGRAQLDSILRWPRPIAQTPDDVVRLWRAAAAAVTTQAAIARFEDLLFTKRDGNGLERVRRATAAYLAAVDASETVDMEVIDALLRVWSLARGVREPDIDDEVRRRMADIAMDVMTNTPGAHPGASLPLLSALAAGPVRAGADPTTSMGCWQRRRPSTPPTTWPRRSPPTDGDGPVATRRSSTRSPATR